MDTPLPALCRLGGVSTIRGEGQRSIAMTGRVADGSNGRDHHRGLGSDPRRLSHISSLCSLRPVKLLFNRPMACLASLLFNLTNCRIAAPSPLGRPFTARFSSSLIP